MFPFLIKKEFKISRAPVVVLVFYIPNISDSNITIHTNGRKEGRKEMFYLTTHSTHLFMVIWCQTYGNGTLGQQERKPAAATIWATLSD